MINYKVNMKSLIRNLICNAVLCLSAMALLQSCEKDNRIDAYPVALQKVTGKWESFSKKHVGEAKWKADTAYDIVRFRYDGLKTNERNEPDCCTPDTYIINKDTVDVSRKDTFKPNPQCAFIDCYDCTQLLITVVRDTLMIAECNGNMTKYVRQ